MFRCVFLTRESDELTDYRNKVKQAPDQFIRISVEIAGDAVRFGRPELETGSAIREAGRTFVSTIAIVTCILVGMLAVRNRPRRSAYPRASLLSKW